MTATFDISFNLCHNHIVVLELNNRIANVNSMDDRIV